MKQPTAEEICEVLELMSMFDDTDEGISSSLLYMFTHCREGSSRGNLHEDWVRQFRKYQKFYKNLEKPPDAATKIHDLELEDC